MPKVLVRKKTTQNLRMSSLEEVLASKDLEQIKKKRSTYKRQLTNAINGFNNKLRVKEERFDHDNIGEVVIEDDIATIKKTRDKFETVYEAILDLAAVMRLMMKRCL